MIITFIRFNMKLQCKHLALLLKLSKSYGCMNKLQIVDDFIYKLLNSGAIDVSI